MRAIWGAAGYSQQMQLRPPPQVQLVMPAVAGAPAMLSVTAHQRTHFEHILFSRLQTPCVLKEEWFCGMLSARDFGVYSVSQDLQSLIAP